MMQSLSSWRLQSRERDRCESIMQHISNLSCSKFSKRVHIISDAYWIIRDSQVKLVVKYPPANAGDAGLIPKSVRFLGEGNGNPLQYSCLENTLDREAWRTIVHRVAKSRMWLKRLNTHILSQNNNNQVLGEDIVKWDCHE